jgi:lipooligosaccharide transport system permease protein
MIAVAVGSAPPILERNLLVYRRTWFVIFAGFFEPLFYLLSLGIGLGHFVGSVHSGGGTVGYASFIAPALLASSAMNGAYYDSTNVFWKLKYGKVYDAMLATPVAPRDVAVAETAWALLRGTLYSVGFLVTALALGLVHSLWALLALPAAVLVGFAFAACGVAATTWMRSWQDYDLMNLAVLPMFLFSATFYPLSIYPEPIQVFVRVTPLYHGIHLVRALTLGEVGWAQLGDVAYLFVMGTLALLLAQRRLGKLLLT